MTVEFVRVIIDIAIALIFLLAAFNKAKSIRDTSRSVRSYRMLPQAWSGVVAILLIITELMLAVIYSLNLYGIYKDMLAMLLLTLFIVGQIKRRDQVHDCGCFGELSWLNRFPISRNIFLLILIACKGLLPQNDSVFGLPTLIGLVAAVLLIDLIMALKELKGYTHDRAMEH